MVTSISRTEQARRDALAAGADAYLLEPVEAAQLVRTVDGFLYGRLGVAAPTPGSDEELGLVTSSAGEIQDISPGMGKLPNVSRRGRPQPAVLRGRRSRGARH